MNSLLKDSACRWMAVAAVLMITAVAPAQLLPQGNTTGGGWVKLGTSHIDGSSDHDEPFQLPTQLSVPFGAPSWNDPPTYTLGPDPGLCSHSVCPVYAKEAIEVHAPAALIRATRPAGSVPTCVKSPVIHKAGEPSPPTSLPLVTSNARTSPLAAGIARQ